MRAVVFIVLMLFIPFLASAGWVVTSPVVHNGELAILAWTGETSPELTVGRFAGNVFYAEQTESGTIALIGVDIETQAGQMPIELIFVDAMGEVHLETLSIEVVQKDRGISRITLPPEMVTPKEDKTLARIERDRKILSEIFARESGPLLADPFIVPVPDVINSPFGKKRVLNGLPRAPHSGTDFRSPTGRLIRAPARGEVVLTDDLYYTGNTVVLDHGAGLYSLYAHLSQPLCQEGQRLEQGQPLGKVGSTGRSTGAHLHWTVRLREARIDPMSILARYGSKTP